MLYGVYFNICASCPDMVISTSANSLDEKYYSLVMTQ